MALKGLRRFVFVVLKEDEEGKIEYNKEITSLKGARDIKVVPKTATAELYGDDQLLETDSSVSSVDVDIDLIGLPIKVQSTMWGHKYENGILIKNKYDKPPKIALGYIAKKSTGGDKFVWLLKGQAEPLGEEAKTQGDKVEYTTTKIKYKFMPRICDGNYQFTADTDEEDALKLEEFFTVDVLKTGKKNTL
ncbi:phage tail protein [Clostridium botulinum C]|uniref:major tail protein n=1 Tax=Clostridium botulinum TaxID=1491 RepID=UPI001E4265F1|nr:major tail protein [Clostridium botulinum]MCD3217829.1 phage tail protein [Clostridium botulinum C]